MATINEWDRYAVVHWTVDVSSEQGLVRCGGRTRAFATLADAVSFAGDLRIEQQQTTRISCGGKTYHPTDIEELARLPGFPNRPQQAAA